MVVEAEGLRRGRRKIERGERQAFEADGVGLALFFCARRRAVRHRVREGLGWPAEVGQGVRVHLDLQSEQREHQYEQQRPAGMRVTIADAVGESAGVRKGQEESTRPGAGPGRGCGAGHRRILG